MLDFPTLSSPPVHAGQLAELDLSLSKGDQVRITSSSSGLGSGALVLGNSFAALGSFATADNDVALTTGKGLSHSAGATPASSLHKQDTCFRKQLSTLDLGDVDVDMGQLWDFKAVVDARALHSELFGDKYPRGAFLDTKDVELLTSIEATRSKKRARPTNYNKRLQWFFTLAKSFLSFQ